MTARPLSPHLCPDCLHGKHAHAPARGCWATVDGQECGCRARFEEGDRFLRGPGAVYAHLTPRDE